MAEYTSSNPHPYKRYPRCACGRSPRMRDRYHWDNYVVAWQKCYQRRCSRGRG